MRELLAAGRRRLRAAWAAATVQLVLPVVAGIVALVALVAWLVRSPMPVWVPAVTVGVVLIAVAVGAIVLRISDYEAARAIERGVRAEDVLTTAMEFDNPEDTLHRDIQRRAQRVAEDTSTAAAIPIRWEAQRLLLAGVLLVAAIGFAVLSPLGTLTKATADEVEILEDEADRLDELAEDVEARRDTATTEEAREELDQLADDLRNLAEELREAESLEAAAERLDEVERVLRDQLDPDLLADRTAVRGLDQQLALDPLAGAQGGAADQFAALADGLDELTTAELEELAERLEALADSQRQNNPAVGEALDQAAEAIRSGDLGRASSALGDAAAAQRRSSGEVSVGEGQSNAAAAAGQAADRIRAAEAAAAGGQGGEGGGGQGNGSGEGEGEGQGQGSGSGAGAGSGQGGQGGSPGSGASGDVSGASPTGDNPSGLGGRGVPGSGEGNPAQTPVGRATVFDPVDAASSEEIQVGIDGGQGQGDIIGRGDAASDRGTSVVPYTDVLPAYLDQAATALDELELPASLRSTIRSYFDNLAEGPR